MHLTLLPPRKSLNKAYLKVKPSRSEIELFKRNLIGLLDGLDESESEEHNKNDLAIFLRNTFYHPKFYINTKDRTDLVIHSGPDAKSLPGIIMEAKRPSNKAEMVTPGNLNAKAFHELILYYLRERITNHNLEIKHLVATNIYEWYVFDAVLFEKLFAQDKKLVQQFTDFEEGRLAGRNTDFFYKEIAEPFLANLTGEICFTWFDFRDYDKPLRNEDKKDDSKLIALYKLLSPEHLLKLPFTNDSNSLDKAFYTELLHIIGLTETKEGSKKLIGRKKEGERNAGSLIESSIIQLDNLDKISRLEKPAHFGETVQERLFNVALELSITWINRILFLKLLEAQLIRYHRCDQKFAFLNCEKVRNFDDLNNLFFGVLARIHADRNEDVRKLFANVPYLNSSLFEPTPIEQSCFFISQLRDSKIPIIGSTVLKDNNGKKLKGELFTLEYLFKFLDAYDFAGEGSEEIQEENKTLINASVLGLIFEKINGYKDGSFFTPGFITMYMCRETIRRAVLQKFKEAKGWECEDLNQLYNKIGDLKEANKIINDLKICDPAVGSGHFLVSALNEIIAIKSELRILADREGKRLKEYHVEVVNDELIITDEDGELFEYNPTNPESQRIQETLFSEKQTIIENCLFGVDINPNSVKICRLRLWIELLKNSYYKESQSHRVTESQSESGISSSARPPVRLSAELETLPNIDINIKCGNSLISRYGLDADIRQALKKSKWTIDSYRNAVMTYRNAQTKDQKRDMQRLIDSIKQDFESEVAANDKRVVQLKKLNGDLFNLTQQTSLFERSKKELADWNKKVTELTTKIKKLEADLEEIKNNKIYENAFEWRFEFPEVLNDEGDFVGFDVVIENPPYVFSRENFDSSIKKFFTENFTTPQYQLNLFFLFIERTVSILRNIGNFALIVPNSLLMVSSATSLREFLLKNTTLSKIVNLLGYTFEGVNVETIIISGRKQRPHTENQIQIFANNMQDFILTQSKNQELFRNNLGFELNIFSDNISDKIIQKISHSSVSLDDLVKIKAGLMAYEIGKGTPRQTPEDVKNRIYDYTYKYDESTFKYLEGKDVLRYYVKWSGLFLRYGPHLAAPRTIKNFNGRKIIIREIPGKYPNSINGTYSDELYLFNRSNIAILERENSDISLKYILGLLNSKLMSYFFVKNTAKSVRQMFPKLILEDLRKFPIKRISSIDQQPFIGLVDQILTIKQTDPLADTNTLEKKIDWQVYELYGLTEEEIRIVEGN